METIVDFLVNSALLLAYSLVFIFIGGFIIDLTERKSNYYLQKAMGYTGIVITGMGTVIHELSHLIMVIVGGMKATEVKLFRPIKGREDGKLGYVSYVYNKRNLYSSMFLVLVGIAPIIGGTIVILISLKVFMPTVFTNLIERIGSVAIESSVFNGAFVTSQFQIIIDFFKELFTLTNITTVGFWIFLFIVLSIASHMSLSKADIMGSAKGIPALYLLMIVINIVLMIFGVGMDVVAKYIEIINVYVIMFLNISVVFSILNLTLSFAISKASELIKR